LSFYSRGPPQRASFPRPPSARYLGFAAVCSSQDAWGHPAQIDRKVPWTPADHFLTAAQPFPCKTCFEYKTPSSWARNDESSRTIFHLFPSSWTDLFFGFSAPPRTDSRSSDRSGVFFFFFFGSSWRYAFCPLELHRILSRFVAVLRVLTSPAPDFRAFLCRPWRFPLSSPYPRRGPAASFFARRGVTCLGFS